MGILRLCEGLVGVAAEVVWGTELGDGEVVSGCKALVPDINLVSTSWFNAKRARKLCGAGLQICIFVGACPVTWCWTAGGSNALLRFRKVLAIFAITS